MRSILLSFFWALAMGCSVQTMDEADDMTNVTSIRDEVVLKKTPERIHPFMLRECVTGATRCEDRTTYAVCERSIWVRETCPYPMVCFVGDCVMPPPPPALPFPDLP